MSESTGYEPRSAAFTQHGERLVPGHNVDRVDIAAGLARGAQLGYDDAESQMVLEYALMRWQRGEEAGAEQTILSHDIAFSSWPRLWRGMTATFSGPNGLAGEWIWNPLTLL